MPNFSIEKPGNQLVQAQERMEATCGCFYEFLEFVLIHDRYVVEK
jgi:hypothetical protein